jgi:two-component system NtrC family sensor kinase
MSKTYVAIIKSDDAESRQPGNSDPVDSRHALPQSNDIFHIMAENSSDLIMHIKFTPASRLAYVSPSCFRITGYTPEEYYADPELSTRFVHPEDTELFKDFVKPNTSCGREPAVLRWIKKDGSIVWTEQTKTVVRDEHGNPVDVYFICRDITQRKLAEDALRESQEFISSLLENAPHATVVINPDTSVRYVNPAWEAINGWTLAEVIGMKAPYLWWPEEYREEFATNFNLAMKQGSGNAEIVAQKKNGERYWIAINWAPVMRQGEMQYLLINSVDITERKLAEEQLRLLSSVTQQVSDATVVTDHNLRITYMNRAAEELFGYSNEEALGKGLDLFNGEQMPRNVIREILRTISSGKVWSWTVPKKRKDGSTIICECQISPLYDEKGQITSYIDVLRDVTGEKEVEAKLQAQNQLIESILATMPEGVLVVGSDDRVILANNAFRKIFHIGRRAITDRPLNEVVRIDQLFKLYKKVKQDKKDNNTLEFRYEVKDIEKIIDCMVIKMDGERTLLTFTDISREREEEEKLYLTDRLASIGEMAAGLAHELNNPLTGVLALSQLLIDSSDTPEEHREDLKCIYSEAQRAASIVKNVLLFARNNNYEHGHASANEAVKDVLRLRAYEEKVSNITVVTNLQENLPEIPIDRFQLQQVFLNIILNAEAAIKEANRPGMLTVTTERANNHININFTDNGCGIKKHIMPRIFDPFFTTKDIGKGTGLGLSICYGIVRKHGGKISVSSRVNKGSTFTIKIPIAP